MQYPFDMTNSTTLGYYEALAANLIANRPTPTPPVNKAWLYPVAWNTKPPMPANAKAVR